MAYGLLVTWRSAIRQVSRWQKGNVGIYLYHFTSIACGIAFCLQATIVDAVVRFYRKSFYTATVTTLRELGTDLKFTVKFFSICAFAFL
jgi:hypothetical protein